MLSKKLYNKAKSMVKKKADSLRGETEGQTGLAAVPIEIGRDIERGLEYLAREERVKLSKGQIDEFLRDMANQKLIVPHPWGGWMAPMTEKAPSVPPIEEAKTMVGEAMKGL